MNRNYSFKRILLLSSVLCTPYVHGQPAFVTLGESAQAGTLLIDRLTGIGYVATAINAGTGVDNIYALTPGSYAAGGTITATGIASTDAQGYTLRLMKLFHYGTSNAPYLVFTSSKDNTQVYMQDATSGAYATGTGTLNDASPHALATGQTSLRALAVNPGAGYLYAATCPYTASTWAGASSVANGINVVPINLNLANPTFGTVQAQPVQMPTTAAYTGASPFMGTFANGAYLADPVLYWDEILGRLYVGSSVSSGGTANDGCVSVLAYYMNASVLTALSTVGNAAVFQLATAASNTSPVHAFTTGTGNVYASVYNLGVMHTSTGFAYLIINGGPTNLTSANTVYAVPLVTGNSTATTNGTFAAGSLTTPDFTVQAIAGGDLPTVTTEYACVGGLVAGAVNPLPCANNGTTTMQVSGDCVYMGIGGAASGTNEGGVFYSTPEFNQYGKIVRWSRWTRAVPAELGTGSNAGTTDGNVQNFVVDGSTGRVWAVDGGTNTIVKVSTVGVGDGTTELATIVNANLSGSCTAIGIFDRTTINFGNNVKGRFALFGSSDGTVVFTMPSEATGGAGYDAVETVYDTYSTGNNPVTLLVTELPSATNQCVTALGGTNYVNTNANSFYFLAGTPNGLYAYALTNGGTGFTLGTTMDTLGSTLFTNANSWQAVTGVTGNITKIATSATLTGVLASNGSTADTLYMLVGNHTTVATLGAAAVTLAVAKTGSLATVNHIYDFKIIYDVTTAGGQTYSQIVIATDQGLYQTATLTGVEAATNQATALWSPVGYKPGNAPGSAVYWKLLGKRKIDSETSFVGIRYTNTRNLSEGQSLDQFCCANYNTANNSVNSFGTGGNGISRTPLDYTSNATITGSTFTNPTINIHDYFTDGLRRIAVGNDISDDTYRAIVWPYDITVTTGWNTVDPTTIGTASSTNKMYCCNLIPDGHFAIGTDDGIILF